MSSNLFDLEHLQQLFYERSKTWAGFLDNVVKNETLEEIEINKLEDFYGSHFDENDSNEELESMEDNECKDDAIDPDILKNVTNTTRFSLLFNTSKTLALPESAKTEENNKLFDIFNQTLPIINEHNRQMKESGFEKILNSFDKQKIEDKVGSWLNRHNTLYGGDNTLLYTASKKRDYRREYQTPSATRQGTVSGSCRKRSPNFKEVSNDSDDSLQSGETARYIRSSRAGAIKNTSSTTTMIKTYRTVRSTREALRKKYACEKADDDYHLKSLRHRRRIVNDLEYHHNHYDLPRLQKTRKHAIQSLPPTSAHKDRRKVLRKRTYSNSCSPIDSSSDSDNYYDEDHRFHCKRLTSCCKQHHYSDARSNYTPKSVGKRVSQRSAIKMPSARLNRMYQYTHSQTKLLSSSASSSNSASFNSISERRQVIKSNCMYYTDNRPCRRESDCRCCNERKLCDEYKHIADTSTEDWYVENSCTPKKSVKTESSHLKPSYKALTYDTEKLPVLNEKLNEERKTKQNKKATNLKNDSDKNPKGKSIKTKPNSNVVCATEDEIFERELQIAIEASKELYEKERETKMNKNIAKKKEKQDIIATKPLENTSKKVDQQPNEFKEQKKGTAHKRQNNKQCNSIDKEDEVIEKVSKLVKKNKKVKLELSNDDTNFIRSEAVPIKMPETKNKDSTITTSEETFFAPTPAQVICNSTALNSKSTAYCRQINEKLIVGKTESNKNSKTTKSITTTKKNATSLSTSSERKAQFKKAAANITVTSTTIRSPEINSTLISSEGENSYHEHSDCTLVTSTTNIEPPMSFTIKQKLEDTQQQDTSASTNYPLTHKGILIYAPHNRSMASANCFTRDGYFTITKEHLSSVIGEKPAEKFLKYYIGRKRFNRNSSIYYRPPTNRSLESHNISSSSDSDDDLDSLGQYGELYESLNKSLESNRNN